MNGMDGNRCFGKKIGKIRSLIWNSSKTGEDQVLDSQELLFFFVGGERVRLLKVHKMHLRRAPECISYPFPGSWHENNILN